MSLSIEKLCKVYPNGTIALKDVTLEISNGMFGLLGPNGAGKSTLMRILATLQEATSGRVMLNELDVLNQKNEVKKILGYLPQEFGFSKKDTPLELLNHFAILRGARDAVQRNKSVEGLLHKVNLWEVRKQKIGNFSGGMKQRLGIALTLLSNPKIIVVDEPTAGLDPNERNRFHNILSELGEDVIVILSTHIVEDVRNLCTAMAIINEGEIVMNESPAQSIQKLKGCIWTREIEKTELRQFSEIYNVISSRLYAGKTIINIFSKSHPDNGFTSSDSTLEDVYFLSLKQGI